MPPAALPVHLRQGEQLNVSRRIYAAVILVDVHVKASGVLNYLDMVK